MNRYMVSLDGRDALKVSASCEWEALMSSVVPGDVQTLSGTRTADGVTAMVMYKRGQLMTHGTVTVRRVEA